MRDETPEITPALSPEEWKQGYDSRDLAIRRMTPGLDGSPRLNVSVHGWPLGGSMGDNRDFHALAALCLYGQSFGFTQEERDLIGFIANEYPLLRPVALKIAALLPPTADDGTPP